MTPLWWNPPRSHIFLFSLIDLTIRYGRQGESKSARSAMWEELCRFRELYCAAFEGRNLSELAAANRYLYQFASIRK